MPVILHVPHSSRVIPPNIRSDILLDDDALNDELNIMTDTATDLIASSAINQVAAKPYLFRNKLSRLVIDPERFPDEREAMNEVGMGAVYLKTSDGERLRAENFDSRELLENYFYPYAQAFEKLCKEILQIFGQVLIIDVHSYRTVQHLNSTNHKLRRPPICIGTDAFHTSSKLRESAIAALSQIGEWVENEPYAGTYVPLSFYQRDARVQSVMLECRADQFLDEKLQPHSGFERVVVALSRLIESQSTKSA